MSQTADLKHLFQLEQILSVIPSSNEWSYDQDQESEHSFDNKTKDENTPQIREDCSSGVSERNSTTSFDPGGTPHVIKDDGHMEKGELQSDNVHQTEHLALNKPIYNTSSSSKNEREILAYSSTKCGMNIVFIALAENNGSKSSIPQLGSIMLKPGVKKFNRYSECKEFNDSSESDFVEDEVATDLNVSVHHIPWYDHGDSSADVLTCVTLCEEKKLCLISCRDGTLFLLPLRVIFPGFQPSSFNKIQDNEGVTTKVDIISQLFSKNKSNDIYPIPKPLYHQRADPTSLIIWSSTDFTVGIVGTLQGKVVGVNIHSGQEVSAFLNKYKYKHGI